MRNKGKKFGSIYDQERAGRLCNTWEQGRKGVRSRNTNQSQSGTIDILKACECITKKIRAPFPPSGALFVIG